MSFPRILLTCLFFCSCAMAADQRIYIGTYTRGESTSDGIYTAVFNDESGSLTEPKLAVEADNPSFLAIHPDKDVLFACIETADFGDKPTGAVSAFQIDRESGKLTLLNQLPTGGGAPCHCVVDGTGRFLLVANYTGGNAAVFEIASNGSLAKRTCLMNHTGTGPNSQRQEGPHAHSINLSDDNQFAYIADLGTDRIEIYSFDAERGNLVPSPVPSPQVNPGGGPRHFSIHPSGRFAYSNNELTAEVVAWRRSPENGGLKLLQTASTLPGDFDGRRSTAECLVHPNGRFVYVSNRGHDSIAAYRISSDDGRVSLIEIQKTGGEEPRNFFINSTGQWLLAENQNSNTIVVFRVAADGSLAQTETTVPVGRPVCIRALPTK